MSAFVAAIVRAFWAPYMRRALPSIVAGVDHPKPLRLRAKGARAQLRRTWRRAADFGPLDGFTAMFSEVAHLAAGCRLRSHRDE
jgi:hypothetical protein